MRKFSLLMGAIGGAMAGYLLSNDKLRKELTAAKTPEEAAKALGKHLQTDGKKVAHEVQKFANSPDVQRNLTKAKKFALTKIDHAKKGVQTMVKRGKSVASKAASDGVKAVKKTTNGKSKNGFKEKKV